MAASTVIVPNILGVSGVNLMPLPASPGYRQQDWQPYDGTTSNTSPYTHTQQQLQWPGSEYWMVAVTLPSLTKQQAAAWTATLQSLSGTLHTFQLTDQLYAGPQNPQGSSGSTPVVDGTGLNAPGTFTLATAGWTPSTFRVLTVGDYLQVGYRLYRVTSSANSDVNGKAVLSIWPSLRETPASGAAIDISHPFGLFRRMSNSLAWTSDFNGYTTLSFTAVEAK
jgi:hypothetical protein